MTRKRFAGIGFVICLIAVLVYGTAHFIGDPSEGSISQVKPVAAPALTLEHVSGHYASFDYRSDFKVVTPNPVVAPVVESFSLSKQSVNSWSINMLVTRLANGSLQDDGSYLLRIRMPERFSRSTQQIDGQSIEFFTDSQAPGFSQTAYLHRGNLDASVSINGPAAQDGDTDAADRLRTVLASWHWQ